MMPNRTFFIDCDTQQSRRSRSLPIRTSPGSVAVISERVQPIEIHQKSDPDAAHRRYARRLAKVEKARTRRRDMALRECSNFDDELDFDQIFECPSIPNSTADPRDATADLAECLEQFQSADATSLTPMERFLVIDPGEEQWCSDSRARPSAIGLREGDQRSAKQRVQSAIKLAADVTMTRRLAAMQGATGIEDGQRREGHEESWLNLDEDSQVSRSGGSRTTRRKLRRTASRADFP